MTLGKLGKLVMIVIYVTARHISTVVLTIAKPARIYKSVCKIYIHGCSDA